MAYTVAWNEASPLGSDPANTLHTIIQNKQIATRERLAGIFGLTAGEWAADPIVPKSLILSVGATIGGSPGNFIIQGSSADAYINLKGAAASGHINWRIGKSVLIANALEFQPSTVADGMVFTSTPAYVTTSGFVGNISGNLTGTVLTAAQGNITSLGTQIATLTINAQSVIAGIGQGIGFQYMDFTNTSGGVRVGVDRSTGGGLSTGTSAYSAVVGTLFPQSLHFVTNSTVRQTIDSAGNVVFTGTVTATLLTAAQPNITSLGTLTGLQVSGRAIFGQGLSPTSVIQNLYGSTSVTSSQGTEYSSGNFYTAFNAFQTGINGSAVDSWTQSLGALGSSLWHLTNISAELYIAPAASAVGNFATFWGSPRVIINASGFIGNLTGNVTGTILTAAQGNITSLGNLTIVNIVNAGGAILSLTGSRAYAIVADTANNLVFSDTTGGTNRWLINSTGHFLAAVNATYDIGAAGSNRPRDIFITGTLTGALSGNVTGNLTGTILTAAQTNITSLGTLSALTVTASIIANGGINMSNFVGIVKLIGGTTGASHRNNVDSVDNLLIADNGDTTVRGLLLVSSGNLQGMTKSGIGNGLGAQITLAKVSTVGPAVANAAQQAWLKMIGSDGVTYQIPAFT